MTQKFCADILHPLSLEDALRGAMQTGRPPAAKKRTATKRRVKGEDDGKLKKKRDS